MCTYIIGLSFGVRLEKKNEEKKVALLLFLVMLDGLISVMVSLLVFLFLLLLFSL